MPPRPQRGRERESVCVCVCVCVTIHTCILLAIPTSVYIFKIYRCYWNTYHCFSTNKIYAQLTVRTTLIQQAFNGYNSIRSLKKGGICKEVVGNSWDNLSAIMGHKCHKKSIRQVYIMRMKRKFATKMSLVTVCKRRIVSKPSVVLPWHHQWGSGNIHF